MSLKVLSGYLSTILKMNVAFLIIPLIYALIASEYASFKGFAVTAVISLVLGLLCGLPKQGLQKPVYIKDGFIVVAASWLLLSLMGALPFYISGQIPSFVDALFESTSGFSTTGATLLPNVESLQNSMLLWRSLTHWIGGLGVLVLLIAMVPSIGGNNSNSSGYNLYRADFSGPTPVKLVPKLRQNAKILVGIYLFLTLLETILLLLGGMPLLDSLTTAFSTAATGGFSVKDISIAAYHSSYLIIVIGIFMMLFGVSFNIYFFLMIRNIKGVAKNEELRVYLIIIAVSTALISFNIANQFEHYSTALMHSFFQVSSIITSTGFASVNYDLWPTFSKSILFLLMFIGACSGSTSNGIKVSRIIILFKDMRRRLFKIGHPRSVEVVKFNGKVMDQKVVGTVSGFFATYMVIIALSFVVVAANGFDFETSLSAVVSCFAGTGPGFGGVGPMENYSKFSAISKLILSFDMILGRVEIYPILLFFSPRTWRKV